MSTQGNAAPVIIKRKKVIADGGHHGGAWKVAYADFVTAMMAFFMLMWLLNATTEKQRKGIADYFSPTIPINRISGGGEGAFGGSSVFALDTKAHDGSGGHRGRPTQEQKAKGESGVESQGEAAVFEQIREALEGRSGDSQSREQILRHVVTRVTDEGLIVEIFDRDGATLFAPDTAEPTQLLKDLSTLVADVFGQARNPVAVNGHVKSYPLVLTANPAWDLSTARAGELRRMLETGGLPRGRLQRVAGFADRKLAEEPPASARNNRMELILLRSRS